MPLELKPTSRGVAFAVRIAPRASRAAISGEHAGALKLAVTAPPVDGAANAAVIELLSEALGVPKSAVEITHGHTSKQKRVHVSGLDEAELRARLNLTAH